MADKLKMHSPNKVEENIRRIGEMFPNCLTERLGEDGKPEACIDFDMLKQELSSVVVEGNEERYQFTWPDKKKSILLANAPISATLRPCREESVDFDNTENLYIEGDNLDVLKLLQETYLGKIKMIYIDPPYNTGNDFVYEDDFAESADEYLANSGQYDDQGNRLVTNLDSNGRFHTDWLNMIYPRLKLAKDLLTENGVIFISIDDNEVSNLIKLCGEIFGERCFVADVSWQRTYSPRNDSQSIVREVEHIVVYSRKENWVPNKLKRTEEMDAKYKNPDNDIAPWTSDNPFAPGAVSHQGMVYAIQHPFTGELIYPSSNACWRYQQDEMLRIMNEWCPYVLKDLGDADRRAAVCGISETEIRKEVKGIVLEKTIEESCALALKVYQRGQWPRFYFTKSGFGGIRRKTYLDKIGGRLPTNLWLYNDVGHTDEAKKELKNLFDGTAPFDTPKPVRLIERVLNISTDKNDYVLDFFSGSATTAHAIMNTNATDGGKRKYILVQLQEESASPYYSNLCEIGKERIRRAGKTIYDTYVKEGLRLRNSGQMFWEETDEYKNACKQIADSIDIGFRVLKLDSSNMKEVYYEPEKTSRTLFDSLVDNIKEDRTPEDLLFQVMLDLGILLSSKIEETEIAGKKVFSVADGFLIACFDADVTDAVITEIAKQKPYYFVTRDHSIASDSVATNFDQIFATYSPETVRKVL